MTNPIHATTPSTNQDTPDQWADFNALRASILAGELPLPPMATKLVDADGQLFELWTKYQSLRAEMAAAAAEIDTSREQNPDVRDFPSVRVLQKQMLDADGNVVRSISVDVSTLEDLTKAVLSEAGIKELFSEKGRGVGQWHEALSGELQARLDAYEIAAREAGLLATCDRRSALQDLADDVDIKIKGVAAETAWGALIKLRIGAAAIEDEPTSFTDQILADAAVWGEQSLGVVS
jgi:hypothetical protein